MTPKMTNKQKVFCDEYLISLNAKDAAIKAGYSKASAKLIGCENLTKPYIKEYIEKKMKEREERTEITQDMVLQELATFGFANIKDFVEEGVSGKDFLVFKNIDKISDDKARAIESIKLVSNLRGGSLEFKLHSKSRGLELIGKHLGMFTERVELLGELTKRLSMQDLKKSMQAFQDKD